MSTALNRMWEALAIRGLIALIFGILCFVWPGMTIRVLIFIFGFFALADGILALLGFFRAVKEGSGWGSLLFEAIVGIVVGLIVVFYPGLSAIALVYWIAAWAIVTGIFEIIVAIRIRKEVKGEWVMVVSGIVSILFGLILFSRPGVGALAVVWIIGIYAIVFGVLMLGLAVRARKVTKELEATV
jgi:uncharacterized membrane protein HdeD (DUF308 family)